jgi:ABC-2 type transport system permease protein
MNNLLNLIKKELKELVTPAMIIMVFVMMFIFMGIGSMVGGQIDSATAPSEIGFIDGDNGQWSEFAYTQLQDFYQAAYDLTPEEASQFITELQYGDNQQITQEMIDKGLSMAICIAPGFSQSIDDRQTAAIDQYFIFKDSGTLGTTVSTAVTSVAISFISTAMSKELMSQTTGITDQDIIFLLAPIQPPSYSPQYTYVNGNVYEGVTPDQLSTAIQSQTMMVPMVMMIIIMMIGSMIIQSMGSEKENKTLETLLTMPVKRTTIVSGKLLAAAIVGVIYGVVYLIGMRFYVDGITRSAGNLNLSDYGLSLGAFDWVLIAATIFLAIFCALGMCMIIGAFAKNYKAAQTMILPISVLAMIPMFITMFTSWGSLPAALKVILFAIPFSHPMMAMPNLMLGDVTLVLGGLVYLVVFTLTVIYITVRLYKSDILLTGLMKNKGGKGILWNIFSHTYGGRILQERYSKK